ncbi:hypothetical protein [Stenomitos frigidus]
MPQAQHDRQKPGFLAPYATPFECKGRSSEFRARSFQLEARSFQF